MLLLALRSWSRRPDRYASDGQVLRVMASLSIAAVVFGTVVLISIGLVDPTAASGPTLFRGAGWVLATIASGFLCLWPVAWRVARTGLPPVSVLWGASACVLAGTCRLLGMFINLASGIVDIPLDGLLLLFGGLGVLERSSGWRRCVTVIWGLVGLVGILCTGAAVLSAGGTGPVLRAGTSELESHGLIAMVGTVAGLVGLTLSALLGGSSARAWCGGRPGIACDGCGYDFRGLGVDMACPECGATHIQRHDE